MSDGKYHLVLLAAVLLVLLWSGINPHDYFTWVLEVLPALIAMAILAAVYKRFRFTRLVYTLAALHMMILIVGGHYTYAEVPLFDWIKEAFNLSRNHYDRVGHLAQGFIPAIVAREVLLRVTTLKPGKMLFFIVVCICLAFSAFYELIEWWVAVATGTAADAFLGSQGDVWDSQWDMFMCMLGSIASQLIFSRLHDRQLAPILNQEREADA
ncbi:MAG: DUF2238 domain-containing protein [Firmicutes bacterium]|nr:DUF2238 domain-containing protein [Bacillota bacterium]